MFVDLLLNLGFAHLLSIQLSLAILSFSNLLLKLVLVLLFLSNLTYASKPSNLNSHSLVSLADLHFLKF
jgi:hypothetical protein